METNERRRPPSEAICLFTRSWRYSVGPLAQQLAESIARQQVKVFLVAPSPENVDLAARHPNVVQMRTPRGLAGKGSLAARVAATVRRMASGVVQVLTARLHTRRFIITTPEIPPVTLPLIAVLRLSGAQVVLVVHDPTPHADRGALIGGLERLMLKALYAVASKIVVLSKSTGKALNSDYGTPMEKISVIPEGMPTLDVPPLSGTRRLLLFGTIRANKMVVEAIQAVETARKNGLDVELVIAGAASQGEELYFASVCKIIADKAHVRAELGYVDDARIPGLFAECDALLLPYRNFESHSSVALQAAAAGRPIIATPSGGIADLFRDGISGVEINACTQEAITAAIEVFFAHPASYWAARAVEARDRLQSMYSWTAAGEKYLRLHSARAG